VSFIIHDSDEWETVSSSGTYGSFAGVQLGWANCGQRRRAPEDVARIKAEKRRQHEDAVLAQAEAIKSRRTEAKP
jgi:hypothetical protein